MQKVLHPHSHLAVVVNRQEDDHAISQYDIIRIHTYLQIIYMISYDIILYYIIFIMHIILYHINSIFYTLYPLT